MSSFGTTAPDDDQSRLSAEDTTQPVVELLNASNLPRWDTDHPTRFWKDLQDSLYDGQGGLESLTNILREYVRNPPAVKRAPGGQPHPITKLDELCGFPRLTCRTMLAWNPETLRKTFVSEFPTHAECTYQSELSTVEKGILEGKTRGEIEQLLKPTWRSTVGNVRLTDRTIELFHALHPDFQRRAVQSFFSASGAAASQKNKYWGPKGEYAIFDGMKGAPYPDFNSDPVQPSTASSIAVSGNLTGTSTTDDPEDGKPAPFAPGGYVNGWVDAQKIWHAYPK